VWGEATGASSSTRRLSGVEGGQVVPGNTIAPQRTEDCWNVVRYVLPCTTNAQNLARKTDKVPPPVLAFFCPGGLCLGYYVLELSRPSRMIAHNPVVVLHTHVFLWYYHVMLTS